MKLALTFAAGFYTGGVTLMTAIEIVFDTPFLQSMAIALGWPLLVLQVFVS